jgi:hypothetical protein
VHPPPNAQQQREELQKKEESRREEQDRRNLEVQLQAFDAHEFYGTLESWTSYPVPKPIRQTIHLTPLRQKAVLRQPIPLSRKELSDLRKISSDCARLLYLLRAIDQRGIECPYVHQQYRSSLEKAIEKCDRLKTAGQDYSKTPGMWARCAQLFNKTHLDMMKKDLDFFKSRLEAILIMCRHEEFAQDLKHIRRAVTYRTGLLLNSSEQQGRERQVSGPRPVVKGMSRPYQGSFVRRDPGSSKPFSP